MRALTLLLLAVLAACGAAFSVDPSEWVGQLSAGEGLERWKRPDFCGERAAVTVALCRPHCTHRLLPSTPLVPCRQDGLPTVSDQEAHGAGGDGLCLAATAASSAPPSASRRHRVSSPCVRALSPQDNYDERKYEGGKWLVTTVNDTKFELVGAAQAGRRGGVHAPAPHCSC